jgi:hypothetical protein
VIREKLNQALATKLLLQIQLLIMRYFMLITLMLLGNVKALGQDVITVSGEKVRAQTAVDAINYEIQNSRIPSYNKTHVAKVGSTVDLGKDGKEISLKFNGVHVGNIFVAASTNKKQNNPESDIAVSELLNSYCREQKAMIMLVLNMLSKQNQVKTKVVVNDCNPIVLAHNAMLNDLNAGLIDYNFALQQYYSAQSSPCGKYLPRPIQPTEVAEEFENIQTSVTQTTCEVADEQWIFADVLEKRGQTRTAKKLRRQDQRRGLTWREAWGFTKREAEDARIALAVEYPICLNDRIEVKKKNGLIIPVAIVAAIVAADLIEDGRLNLFNIFKRNKDVAVVAKPIINPNESGEGGIFGGNGSGGQGGRSNSGGKRSTNKTTGW